MMIGIGFDNYPEEIEVSAVFEEIIGLDGNNIIKTTKADDGNEYRTCAFVLKNGRNIEQFIAMLETKSKINENNGCLILMDENGKHLGGHLIYSIVLKENIQGNDIRIEAEYDGGRKGLQKAWNLRCNNSLDTYNLWKSFKHCELEGWLEVAAQLQGHIEDRDIPEIKLNGTLVDCDLAFYCALGEAVNGPGGYFGFGLDGLADCFCGGYGAGKIFRLVWTDYNTSRENIGNKYFSSITKLLEEMGVEIDFRQNIKS